ncbi:MAG: SDR family oxidoreductase [Micromonosporaceae bacterium]|nr:SDR family oxidoreductase [Micromonosporaceae bacterium]
MVVQSTGLLAGRRAVVTGGANGIGRAVAERFRTEGAQVAVIDAEPADIPGVPGIQADLSDLDRLPTLAADVQHELGHVDILVNSAGVFQPCPVTELDRTTYDQILAVNLHAPVFLTRHLVPGMTERGYGSVLNISSIHGEHGEAASLAYDVSKAGLNAATRTFAIELAAHGVLVNAIAPGFVNTRMAVTDGVNELQTTTFRNIYLANKKLPIGRPAEPAEVAPLAAWLCSERNTYLTGQVVTMDGGLTATF